MRRKPRTCDYVCPNCFQRPAHCTCSYPPYQLIMVDTELQEAIQQLNATGYSTIDCCAGHWGMEGQSCYISFHKPLPTAPEGWRKERNVIRYHYTARTKKEFCEQKKQALAALYEWLKNF